MITKITPIFLPSPTNEETTLPGSERRLLITDVSKQNDETAALKFVQNETSSVIMSYNCLGINKLNTKQSKHVEAFEFLFPHIVVNLDVHTYILQFLFISH